MKLGNLACGALTLALLTSQANAQVAMRVAGDQKAAVHQDPKTNDLIVMQQDVASVGTLNAGAANSSFSVPVAAGVATVSFYIYGLAASGASVALEAQNAVTGGWQAVNSVAPQTGILAATLTGSTADGNYRVNAAGHTALRFRVSVAGTGTITVYTNNSVAPGLLALSAPLPAGSNQIGTIGNLTFGATQSGTWSMGLTGTLPGFASTPTFNCGTGCGGGSSNLGGSLSNNDTATALAASAVFQGLTRDVGQAVGAQAPWAYFNAFFLADQAGTAEIDCSNDNSTWYICASASMAANTPVVLQFPVMTRYHRVKLTNLATAETVLHINDSYSAS